ncbi:MAG: CBS domain-containing protein [Halobacteriota archaeon]|nr:CBS domain-containing protein [Halobacteriota archaeon]
MPTKTKVEDLMTTDVIYFKPGDKIKTVTDTLGIEKISGAPVIDDEEKVVGVVSESDIMNLTASIPLPDINLDPFDPLAFVNTFSHLSKVRHMWDDIKKQCETLMDGTVEEIMSRKVVTVSPDDDISHVAHLMHKNDFNRLPVVDENNRLLGIIARGDVIGVLVSKQ